MRDFQDRLNGNPERRVLFKTDKTHKMTAEKKHLFSPALKRMIDMGMQYDRAYVRRCISQRYNCSIGRILTWKEYNGVYGVTDALKRVLDEVDAEASADSLHPFLVDQWLDGVGYQGKSTNNLRNYKKIDTAECVPGQACDLATCRGRYEYCAACDMVV